MEHDNGTDDEKNGMKISTKTIVIFIVVILLTVAIYVFLMRFLVDNFNP